MDLRQVFTITGHYRRLVKSGFVATLNSGLLSPPAIAPGKSTNLEFRNLNHKPTVVLKWFDKL